MVKWGPVILGFVLAVFVKMITPSSGGYEFVALLIVGAIVGYLSHDGVLGGFINGGIAGGLGGIIIGLLVMFIGILGIFISEPFGLTISGIGFVLIIVSFITYGLTMAIGGAVGGMISDKK
ncbi:DUF5518 domain-containing protein [Methanobrevibacter curvatus]|uniref:DUF5518 domain-containing protein n=1 Tax=Methanobrevibacter curvatus TaxID=49547 RepID=A0A166E8S8_9EURY|nr:DUF5518 domain-containing protein [Methanobrevibacter curvatus]KZX16399.1 hypothetical protein MBCUR_00630 [Methanobrevibacter curvatus]